MPRISARAVPDAFAGIIAEPLHVGVSENKIRTRFMSDERIVGTMLAEHAVGILIEVRDLRTGRSSRKDPPDHLCRSYLP